MCKKYSALTAKLGILSVHYLHTQTIKWIKTTITWILSQRDACQGYLLMIKTPKQFLLHLFTYTVRAWKNVKKLMKMHNFCSCFRCFWQFYFEVWYINFFFLPRTPPQIFFMDRWHKCLLGNALLIGESCRRPPLRALKNGDRISC